jgi:hypothetical protein
MQIPDAAHYQQASASPISPIILLALMLASQGIICSVLVIIISVIIFMLQGVFL